MEQFLSRIQATTRDDWERDRRARELAGDVVQARGITIRDRVRGMVKKTLWSHGRRQQDLTVATSPLQPRAWRCHTAADEQVCSI